MRFRFSIPTTVKPIPTASVALYGQTPPLVNASKAPGEWQSYDVIFESPRWSEDGALQKKANVTVIHNGVVLHHKREFSGATDGIGGIPHLALGAYY